MWLAIWFRWVLESKSKQLKRRRSQTGFEAQSKNQQVNFDAKKTRSHSKLSRHFFLVTFYRTQHGWTANAIKWLVHWWPVTGRVIGWYHWIHILLTADPVAFLRKLEDCLQAPSSRISVPNFFQIKSLKQLDFPLENYTVLACFSPSSSIIHFFLLYYALLLYYCCIVFLFPDDSHEIDRPAASHTLTQPLSDPQWWQRWSGENRTKNFQHLWSGSFICKPTPKKT